MLENHGKTGGNPCPAGAQMVDVPGAVRWMRCRPSPQKIPPIQTPPARWSHRMKATGASKKNTKNVDIFMVIFHGDLMVFNGDLMVIWWDLMGLNKDYITAWWWLEHDIYFSIQLGNVIIPIDELIFFGGVGIPPTSKRQVSEKISYWYFIYLLNKSSRHITLIKRSLHFYLLYYVW